MDNLPTIESIKAEYPNPITADANEGLIRVWLEELPADKKNVIPWDNYFHSHINTYVGEDVIETDEFYPQCNYCIGGALQMAFGETEPDNVDDSRDGIFPGSDILADTLHYYCMIPYSGMDALFFECGYDAENVSKFSDIGVTDPCPFPQHKDKDCLMQFPNDINEGAFELADKITKANDRGDFDYAWSYVEFALELGRKNLKENK